ncbi:hypothetical protein BKA61DRAFT_678006 [Leptodontidium sp. MPI-SDFR-AT-0119]|nr:hypothetical protein BKA61DRAFT_678006 [Leptodontidium sp. MPI-SDFR-AT-0119]
MSPPDRLSSYREYQELRDRPGPSEELRSLQQECNEKLEQRIAALEGHRSLLDSIIGKVEYLTNVLELTNLSMRDKIVTSLGDLKDAVQFIAEIQTRQENSMEQISDKIAKIEIMIASSTKDTSAMNENREQQRLKILSDADGMTKESNASIRALPLDPAARAAKVESLLEKEKLEQLEQLKKLGLIVKAQQLALSMGLPAPSDKDPGLLPGQAVRERTPRMENPMDPIPEQIAVPGDTVMSCDQAEGSGLELWQEVSISDVVEGSGVVAKESANVWMNALYDVLNDFCLCLFWVCTGVILFGFALTIGLTR